MLQIKFRKFPLLNTDRLYLRRIRMGDAPDLFALRTNEQVMGAIGKPLSSYQEIKGLISKMEEDLRDGNGITWGMAFGKKGHIFGTIGLWRIIKPHHRAEIGYMLDPGQHRKGLMKEAMKAVLDYGFNTLKLHSIEANLGAKNEASKALLESCGFVQEGYFKENYCINGKFEDSKVYSLVVDSWKEL